MPAPVIQPSFAAGELSPFLYGRVDLAKFHVGARTMLNFFVHPHGGASNRPGTRYVGPVDDHTARHRLIPFQFRSSPAGQNYALLFGNLTMQVVMNGGFVLLPTKTITGATQANPGVLTITGHGYTTGSLVAIAGVVGMTQLNGNSYTVTVVDADHVSIGVNTTGFGAYGSGGTAGGNVFTLASPYTVADLATLKFVQSADIMTFTHPGYAPRNLSRTGHAAWTLGTITFAPTISPPTGVAPTSAGTAGSYGVTAISDATGEESLLSATVGTASVTGAAAQISWSTAAGVSTWNVYKAKGSIYGFVAQVTTNSWTDDNIAPNIGNTPPGSRNPFATATNWPSCSTYYQQRQVYGATTTSPQTLWFSGTGGFQNMNSSQPTKDDDAITRALTSRQVNEIRHLVPGQSLLVMTSGAEWRCYPGPSAPGLTPAACATLPQTSFGCSHVPPIQTANSVLFVQERGSRVRELRFDVLQDQYQSMDMSVMSSHLFYDTTAQYTIQEWAFAEEPFRIAWAARDDGTLLGFTFMREHEVYAWHRHATDGAVESVCSIPEVDGNSLLDAVYLIVRRTIGGVAKRYVERMAPRHFATMAEAWFVDCGLQYNGWNTDGTKTLAIAGAGYAAGATVTMTAAGFTPFTSGSVGKSYTLRAGSDVVTVQVSAYTDSTHVSAVLGGPAPASLRNIATADWSAMVTVLTGLDHLEGKSVAILGDGSIVPSQPVSGGAVALDGAYSKVTAGLPFTADLETLNLELPAQGGTIQGQMKKIAQVTIRVKDARGVAVGLSQGALQEVKQRSAETLGTAMAAFNGDFAVQVPSEWNRDGRLFVRQSYPLPCTILDLIPEVNLGD